MSNITNMDNLPKLKITGRYHRDFNISIDCTRLEKVIDAKVQFQSPFNIVTVRMYADVEIETDAKVNQEMFTFINKEKYKLVKVKE